MTAFLADTHALVWHLTDPGRLGRGARRAFDAADAGQWLCYVPVVGLVELSLLYERGRLRIGPSQVLEALSEHPGYAVLPLDLEQALAFGAFSSVRDPMDRLILAASRATRSRLVSRDARLDGHGIERLWE